MLTEGVGGAERRWVALQTNSASASGRTPMGRFDGSDTSVGRIGVGGTGEEGGCMSSKGLIRERAFFSA